MVESTQNHKNESHASSTSVLHFDWRSKFQQRVLKSRVVYGAWSVLFVWLKNYNKKCRLLICDESKNKRCHMPYRVCVATSHVCSTSRVMAPECVNHCYRGRNVDPHPSTTQPEEPLPRCPRSFPGVCRPLAVPDSHTCVRGDPARR